MDTAKTDRFVADAWDGEIVPQLVEYIRIPEQVADVRRRTG